MQYYSRGQVKAFAAQANPFAFDMVIIDKKNQQAV
jgi:hypothetical protein